MASSQQLILGEGAGGAAPAPQYQISRSLRFNSAENTYLNRTPGSVGDQQKWTWSGWYKVSKLGLNQYGLFSTRDGVTNNRLSIGLQSDNTFIVYGVSGGVEAISLTTTQVFRDVSAWYHIVIALDTTQATAANRCKVYVNGSQITAFSTANYPTQNANLPINQASEHNIGQYALTGNYIDGYLTEINFINGQALTPSSFGETNSATGVWQPKAYSGTYGTNGFYLNFSDNSNTTSTTLGKDYSGNGNNWTPNNFSVTAGTGNDSFVDSPTAYGTDTGVGGEVRGNYATWNPLWYPETWGGGGFYLANGNLQTGDGSDLYFNVWPTIMPTTGKWYLEKVLTSTNSWRLLGIQRLSNLNSYAYYGSTGASTVYMLAGGDFAENTTSNAAWYGVNDVISMAIDFDNRAVWFAKNGSWIDGNGSESSATVKAQIEAGNTSSAAWTWASTINDIVVMSRERYGIAYTNFGQRAFSYTAPSGFKCLVSTNLPTPTIGATSTTQAGKYFNPVLYTGNSTIRSITGVGFQPDFVWIKDRSNGYSHRLADAVRGAGKELYSDDTAAETTNSANGYVSSFDSNGFGLQTGIGVNNTGVTYVSWNWNAGGSNATNTTGTLTSTVRANTTAGFSVVTYTGNGSSSATVGHGLTSPAMVILKRRSTATLGNTDNWTVKHTSLAGTQQLRLNQTGAAYNAGDSAYGGISISTSTFGFLTGTTSVDAVNENNATYVAYCFAPVAGYSAFGSYTGNGSTDGPFVYLGFQPKYIMLKRTDNVSDWVIQDDARNTYNPVNSNLWANLSLAEVTSTYNIDFVSNGFKFRTTTQNASSGAYIYAAFAEFPFKYTLAR